MAASIRTDLGRVTGSMGPTGAIGPTGNAATIAIGTVTAGNPGTNPVVTNTGNANAAVFAFTIPRGDAGTTGGGITESQAMDAVREGSVNFDESPGVNASWASTNLASAPVLGAGWALTSGTGANGTYTHSSTNTSELLSYPVSNLVAGDFYEAQFTFAPEAGIVDRNNNSQTSLSIQLRTAATGGSSHSITRNTFYLGSNANNANVVFRVPSGQTYTHLTVTPFNAVYFRGTFQLARVHRLTTQNSITFLLRGQPVITRPTNSLFIGGGGRAMTAAEGTFAFGPNSLLNGRSGSSNIAIGSDAAQYLSNGSYNTALGSQSMYASFGGSYNFMAGYYTGYNHVAGSYNCYIGYYAGMNNTNGNYNIAIGSNCLGYGGPPPAGNHSQNIALGNYAMSRARICQNNVAIGAYAMQYDDDGHRNVALGFEAGLHWAGGLGNYRYGGTDQIFLGARSKALADGGTNEIVIGANAVGGGSNTITLGNDEITELRCQVTTISAISDTRVKEEIAPADLSICLDAVHELPVHRWQWSYIAGVHRDRHVTGFLAEEIRNIFPKAVTTENEWFVRRNEDGSPIMVEQKREERTGERNEETGEWTEIVTEVTEMVPDRVLIEDVERINLTEIVPTLWGAVQLLAQQIEELRGSRVGGGGGEAAVATPAPAAAPPIPPPAAPPQPAAPPRPSPPPRPAFSGTPNPRRTR
jgi:hypothetical protein